ncbi:carbohydrate kinase family protein [Amphibacillus sp. Q70]|uniref:carbohydrate kinase family protein n=1 Tax=Amphibacillus sp. Q70 TaxID=3453416 RepID=UPI003F84E17D
MSDCLDIMGIGYPSLDYVIRLNDEPSIGKTSLITTHNHKKPYFGGCVVNIIYLLNTLGYNCGLTMTVGKDFKESGFEKFLTDNKVSLQYTNQNNDLNTSYTNLLMTPNGEHITLFSQGPMSSKLFCPQDFNDLNVKYGLLTIGEPNANKHFLNVCIENNIPTIFSMKGDYHSLDKEYLVKVIEHSEVIFMNDAEYAQLNQYLPQKILSYLSVNENKVIVITLGSKGSLVFSNKGDYFVNSYPEANVVDTTGGGDAYIAGFLSQYLENKTLEEAVIRGTALSSCIIEDFGCLTNIPTMEELQFRENKIKESINYERADTILRTYQR